MNLRPPLTITLLILLTLSTFLYATAETVSDISPRKAEEAIRSLDRELEKRDLYISIRRERIDSIDAQLSDGSLGAAPRLRLLEEKGDLYNRFITDSAMTCYSTALQQSASLPDSLPAIRLRLKYAACTPAVGHTDLGLRMLNSVNIDSVPTDMKRLAYECAGTLYEGIADLYPASTPEHRQWAAKAADCKKILIDLTDKDSREYMLMQGEQLFLSGNHRQAKAILSEMLASGVTDPRAISRAADLISRSAEADSILDERLYYLALKAEADLKSATAESTALMRIGEAAYEKGDFSHARKYLTLGAQATAGPRNADIHPSTLAAMAEVYGKSLRSERIKLFAAIALTVILAAAVTIAMVRRRRMLGDISTLQKKLQEADSVNMEYVDRFMKLCLNHARSLNRLNDTAIRKISAGRTEELLRMLKSGKLVSENIDEFYEAFDRTFTLMHPNFITEVNRLLLPDRQITLSEGEILNTDLRILALMRLGIAESPDIAAVMNYSLNTVYNYRNRLKNRAIDRDNFEFNVMLSS